MDEYMKTLPSSLLATPAASQAPFYLAVRGLPSGRLPRPGTGLGPGFASLLCPAATGPNQIQGTHTWR